MRICYVLISPTFGMHQYTADLANRLVQAGHDVSLVTTSHYPPDRYLPDIHVSTPVDTRDSGFSADALRLTGPRDVEAEIGASLPDVVHITGPHAWNVTLLWMLSQAHLPAIHSLHDLDPHAGTSYGRLLNLWNEGILRQADHLLVHGRCHRERLVQKGVPPRRVTYTPLLHLSLGQAWLDKVERVAAAVTHEPWVLFFGRMELYKGLHVLAEAAGQMRQNGSGPCIVAAGPGQASKLLKEPLPANMDVRNRLIPDDESVDLFSRCGVVVLPYIEASQSAVVAAAYFFQKPVIVTRVGALPEYVVEGETGWVIPPDDPPALAACIREALSDPERLARMGRAGRDWYNTQRQTEGTTLREMYTSCYASFS